ncbi:MAG TPA: uroporphyrinogen-III synthase [Steroidobacteraceae bacterium]
MTAPLAGITLVVTRPAAQAGHFIELARAAGAACVAFPTLEIEPLAADAATLARVREGGWNWAIFTSTNAVECGGPALAATTAAHLAAVGRATARALEARGRRVDARPESANSEGLLALPEFAQVAGERILVVKGSGGRDLLRRELVARGADVLEFEVYRRSPAAPDAAARQDLRHALATSGAWVAVTSAEVLEALLQLVAADERPALLESALLVPGERVAAVARRLGWRGPVVTAPTAEDATMLEALRLHLEGRPATP